MLRKSSRMADSNTILGDGDGIANAVVPRKSRFRETSLIRNCWLLMPIILLIVITFAVIPKSKRPIDVVSSCSVGAFLRTRQGWGYLCIICCVASRRFHDHLVV